MALRITFVRYIIWRYYMTDYWLCWNICVILSLLVALE